MTKKSCLGMLVLTWAFTTIGCILSGTYTHNGSTAIFRGDATGTATVSGNTLTGTFDGMRFTATRANTDTNVFAGTWMGVVDGDPMEFAFGDAVWAVSVF